MRRHSWNGFCPYARQVILLAAAADTCLRGPAYAQCQYEVTIIQAPECQFLGPPVTRALGINELGHVVGDHDTCDGVTERAFLWTPEDGLVTLPLPPDASSARAGDINDFGVITGVAREPFRGFVYDNGEWTILIPPGTRGWNMTSAINNAGEVVGQRSLRDDLNPMNAYVWSAGSGYTDLGLMDAPKTDAADINNLGQVVGRRDLPESMDEAFIWHKGELTLLGPVPGGFSSIAGGNNDRGQVVGGGHVGGVATGDAIVVPFLWDDGEMVVLDSLPESRACPATDINEVGQIVGRCTPMDSNNATAVLWQHGDPWKLEDLVLSLPDNVELGRAFAINNAGQIAGDGSLGGDRIGFLLTPLDRPASDIDGDCETGLGDLLFVVEEWSNPGSFADVNDDGTVDVSDLIMVILGWDLYP